MDETGEKTGEEVIIDTDEAEVTEDLPPEELQEVTGGEPPQKYYVDNGWIEIAAHVVYDLDEDGKKLRPNGLIGEDGSKLRPNALIGEDGSKPRPNALGCGGDRSPTRCTGAKQGFAQRAVGIRGLGQA